MGHSDLSPDPSRASSLTDRIREGDPDAISTFREEHLEKIRAYCNVACTAELVDAAVTAGFLDFVARVSERRPAEDDLQLVLLRATRAAAAPRMTAEDGQAECAAVPELLAARANGELPGSDRGLQEHLRGCTVCQGISAQISRAVEAFLSPAGTPARAEAPAAAVAPAEPPPAATAAPGSPPVRPGPAQPPLPAPTVRRRTGGLAGAIRKRIQPPGS